MNYFLYSLSRAQTATLETKYSNTIQRCINMILTYWQMMVEKCSSSVIRPFCFYKSRRPHMLKKKTFQFTTLKSLSSNGGVPGGIRQCCVVWVACGMGSTYALTTKAVVKSCDQPRRTLQKHCEFIEYLIFELILIVYNLFLLPIFAWTPHLARWLFIGMQHTV